MPLSAPITPPSPVNAAVKIPVRADGEITDESSLAKLDPNPPPAARPDAANVGSVPIPPTMRGSSVVMSSSTPFMNPPLKASPHWIAENSTASYEVAADDAETPYVVYGCPDVAWEFLHR